MNTPAPGASVRLRNVARRFVDPQGAAVQAVSPTDLDIDAGDFVALIGPSGCGKSTLLRAVAGLDRDVEGTIELAPARAPRISFVFQEAQLLPWRTVADNVALPLELANAPAVDRARAIADALAQVELSDAANRYPAQLSGGMRMRVSIARALVTTPDLLLMDEPFAALDELTRNRLDERLRALWLRHRFTVVFVTHSIQEAVFLARRALVMSRRPGRIVHDRGVDLPEARDAHTRATPAFAHISGELLDALESAAR
jgi:NitT/TauT family transport system ATP-binding protein